MARRWAPRGSARAHARHIAALTAVLAPVVALGLTSCSASAADSIDYAVVMSGEIDMELDDSVVHLKAGDVLVQRGTIHNWVNRGSEPCVIAFILIDAKPVEVGGKVLTAEG